MEAGRPAPVKICGTRPIPRTTTWRSPYAQREQSRTGQEDRVPADPSGDASPAVRSARPLRRRSVLAAAAMTFPLLATSCKGVGALGTPPTPLPDTTVLGQAITAETLMIARYRAAISGSPGQTALLAPLLAQHQAHLARLTSRLLDPQPASSTRSASPGPPATSLSALQAAEENAANGLVRHLAEVTPSLAQLLASIAASEASHALLLRSRGGVP
jgi:hypothetical protein